MSSKAKSRRNPGGLQGFLTKSGRKIRRQDVCGEILNRLLNMRLLFAMQIHDAETQAALADEIKEIDRQIMRMTSNRKTAGGLRF